MASTANFINIHNGKTAEIEVDDEGYIRFGDIAINVLSQQCQYASRYLMGTIEGYPALALGLRLKGNPDDYHFVRIHAEDTQTFIDRYKEHRARMLGC